MNTIISFIIPCYNSETYLRRAVESVLGFDSIEIILVDDGSDKDNTPLLCDEYARKYSYIRVVHQENGGHGSAVQAGIALATGVYCKIIDSDDWLDREALNKILCLLTSLDTPVDACIANYVYEHANYRQKVMKYTNVLPQNTVFSWKDIGRFKVSQYVLMHSVIYRRELLATCGLSLPRHTFYVDNLFVYQPLPFVKQMYYIDVDLYRYYIGRDDQSVNQEVMKSRVDQQVLVTKAMITAHDVEGIKTYNPRLARYMVNKVSMMMAISTIFLLMHKNKRSLKVIDDLWIFLKCENSWLYRKIRWQSIAFFTHLPGSLGRKITLGLYKIVRRVFKFN